MAIEILRRTPPWVFVLFFVLLALGYFQSKGRTVGRHRVALLPVAMVMLSFYGVISAFGMAPASLAAWTLGVAIAAALGIKHAAPHGVKFITETQSFFIPGSWLPLMLMMAIFFTKYAVGVLLARQLPLGREAVFIACVSFCYGLFSGVFVARAIGILRAPQGIRHHPL